MHLFLYGAEADALRDLLIHQLASCHSKEAGRNVARYFLIGMGLGTWSHSPPVSTAGAALDRSARILEQHREEQPDFQRRTH